VKGYMRRKANESMNVQSSFGLSKGRINAIGEKLADMIETRSRTRLLRGSQEIARFSPSSCTVSIASGIPHHERSSFSLHL
jgi:hypothetical protein